MRISDFVQCLEFPCTDVIHENYILPEVDIAPESISVIMISETAPAERTNYYYAGPDALFTKTTLLAFQDAGIHAASIQELLDRGIYLTTAVKCGKVGSSIQARTIQTCSHLLEKELALFPNVKAILLMGDVAINAMNAIARRNGQGRVIPAGATYKIRGQKFTYRGIRVFPSYLQAGPSFFIEKSKRKMIAEDIAQAMELASIA